MDTSKLLSPPSPLFPAVGAGLGWLVSESLWGVVAGAALGALWNAGSTGVAMEGHIAAQHGVNLNDNGLSLAARSFIGQGAAKPVQDVLDSHATGARQVPVHHHHRVRTPWGRISR
jgi:hypothetical protein